jgi:Fe-S-cluster containining protein
VNCAERRRAEKLAERKLSAGMEADNRDPYVMVALVRRLHERLEFAKQTGDVSPFVRYLFQNTEATRESMADVPVACAKGCSHCCNIWVATSAPEVLHVAKIIKSRGPAAIEKVQAAYMATKNFPFDQRDQHPYPCPLLDDHLCSIYPDRPNVCRLAASGDADICARSYNNITDEDIPTPIMYLMGRGAYAIAIAIALKHSGFAPVAYEYNSALHLALQRDDAERAWLSGENVFSGAVSESGSAFENPDAQTLYDMAFG